jgi:hypothetical protein
MCFFANNRVILADKCANARPQKSPYKQNVPHFLSVARCSFFHPAPEALRLPGAGLHIFKG